MAINIYETNLKLFLTFFSLLTLLTVALLAVHISIGPAMFDPIPQKAVVNVVSLRLTRALATLLSGATLALAGLLMQTIY